MGLTGSGGPFYVSLPGWAMLAAAKGLFVTQLSGTLILAFCANDLLNLGCVLWAAPH